ncbi:MAG: hypothetical protein ABIQ02_02065 [Saprospiraceae bacterium]
MATFFLGTCYNTNRKTFAMPMYTLRVIFQSTSTDGEITQKIFEKAGQFRNVKAAEKALETQMSDFLSEFSSQSIEWIVLEKCVTLIQNKTSLNSPSK